MPEPTDQFKFPDNAYRELQPGEQFVPMVPPNASVPELTQRMFIFGLIMNIVFSVAATFLALKAGQGIETAIPISILAVGLSGFILQMGGRASSILENVYVLAISTTSGYVAGGTCFTMPAIYILKLNTSLEIGTLQLFLQIALVPLIGAVLGALFLIPFRRYFVKEMHGKLPFPEATATNEILVTGASGSTSQAWILIYSFVLSALYTFVGAGLKLFGEAFTTGKAELNALGKEVVYRVDTLAFGETGLFATLTQKVKAVIELGTGAVYLGLGFIIGLRYASIICAGSFLSALVITPMLGRIPLEHLQAINPAVASTDAHDIWFQIPRIVGIGAIFTAGLLSIVKMGKVIVTALVQALGGLLSGKGGGAAADRTDEDLSYPTILGLGFLTVVVMTLFFRYMVLADLPNPWWMTLISVLLALLIGFLFTTVSAWAIAMISVTPISGMTVTTIIITAVLMSLAGLPKGDAGMMAVLMVGGVVCTALSMAGGLVTNFKMGYWLGASPKRITWNALIGAVVSAIFVCGTIMILDSSAGYTPDKVSPLPAPQANMMAGALQSFLGSGEVPWLLYGIGVVMALTMELLGISALAFGLGMYLPMSINLPILIGAFVAWMVKKSTRDKALSGARSSKGILIASGLVAGGAIMEVLIRLVDAIDQQLPWKASLPIQHVSEGIAHVATDGGGVTVGKIIPFIDASGRLLDGGSDPSSLAQTLNWAGLGAFLFLCLFVFVDCLRAKPSEDAPSLAEH